jgi:YegS/Rv2252/BmrU family lipid kinase
MTRALLITNPGAGRMNPGAIRAVTAGLASRGLEVDVAGTTRPGDAAELARQGVDDGADLVVVYGGDGTAMQAVQGIVGRGRDVPIGLIPGGTGNILAGNLRIPASPTRAAEVVARGVTRRLDLGRVMREDGPHYFAVNCGTGFDAQLMAATTGPAKRRWGMGAYVAEAMRGLGDLTSVPHFVTVDGEAFEAEAASIMIFNCAELVPPILRVSDDIANDDGVLDLIILQATSVAGSVAVLGQLLLGRKNGGGVRHARGRCISIHTQTPRPVQLDGEPTGTTPFTAEVLPGALKIFVP